MSLLALLLIGLGLQLALAEKQWGGWLLIVLVLGASGFVRC
jgi:hypothetical protein